MSTADDFLTGNYFSGETFVDLELPGTDLTGKELERCTFRRCKLPESRWAETLLDDCEFEDCDLSRIDPRDLSLRGVTFKNTKLVGINWKGVARGPTVSFEGCDLRYASFVTLRLGATRVIRCGLREAQFIEADLTGADFSESDLTGATIQGCTLAKANFSRARGVFFEPARNVVKGARIGIETLLLIAESFGMVVETE